MAIITGLGGGDLSKLKISRTTSETIYRNLTKDFTLPGNSPYSSDGGYRQRNNSQLFSTRYDEPTYLTFRIEFDFNSYGEAANATNGTEKFNTLPHPLLFISKDKEGNVINDVNNAQKLNGKNGVYSTYDYLINNLGEDVRADILLNFIKGLKDIQDNFPYYFKEITGLNNYLKIDPASGRRIKSDSKQIVISCDEALDLRITQLLSSYKKVVWDDVYQRWMVPDMMRFFKMRIYISEIRLFHFPKSSKLLNTKPTDLSSVDLGEDKGITNILSDLSNDYTLVSDAINEVLPTIVLECEQCEFDITDTMSHIDTLKSYNKEAPQPKIKINVGNVKETHLYGLNKSMESLINESNLNGKLLSIDENLILSDELLYKYMFVDDEISENTKSSHLIEAKELSKTINRLGYDMFNLGYSPVQNPSIENAKMIGNVLESVSPGLTNSVAQYMGNNMNIINSLGKYGINMRMGSPLANLLINPLENLSAAALRSLDTAIHNSIYDMKAALLNSRIGDSVATTGFIIDSLLHGDVFSILKMIKDSIFGSPAMNDLRIIHGIDMGPDALKGTLREIQLSSNGNKSNLIKAIDWILNSGMSAADIGRYIDDGYDKLLKGYSNSALNYENYRQVTLNGTPIRSSAVMGTIQDTYIWKDPYIGGFINHGYYNPPYMSLATIGAIYAIYPYMLKGVSNTAVSNIGAFYPSLMFNPPYTSSANSGNGYEPYSDTLKGTSNMAVQYAQYWYKYITLINPPYRSTANMLMGHEVYQPWQKGTSNEAIEDVDSGYKDSGMSNIPYSSEANEDKDNGYRNAGLINQKYISTATEKQ